VNPLFFGRAGRQLYGVYEAPESRARAQAIVICPPFGREYLFAHPTERLLARQLAGAGFHVLRFDYFGTGDSAGGFEDANPSMWREDIESAVAEVRDLGQVARVGLIGLRYGALFAAQAAAHCGEIEQLVLWDPIVDGKAYLQSLGTSAEAPGMVDVNGLAMGVELRAAIETVTPEHYVGALPRTLIVSSPANEGSSAVLEQRLSAAGVECSAQDIDDEPAWRERRVGLGAMPVATIRGIVAWLS
jgi:alpha/beta superfamily hydrolase